MSDSIHPSNQTTQFRTSVVPVCPISKSIQPMMHSIHSIYNPIHLRFRLLFQLNGPRLVLRICRLILRRKPFLFRPRLCRGKGLLHQMALKEATFHFGNSIVPIGCILFEEWSISQQASDPSSEDDAGPVSDRSSEGYPCRCRGVCVPTVLNLREKKLAKPGRGTPVRCKSSPAHRQILEEIQPSIMQQCVVPIPIPILEEDPIKLKIQSGV